MWSGFQNENGTLIISSFGIMMFLAFLSCNILMRKTLREKNISVDIGQVMFKPTVTISSDIWKQNQAKSNANPNQK